MAHIYGYSATTIASPTSNRDTTNSYGTTLSTTSPESSVTITQSQWPETSTITSYKNGYIMIGVDNIVFGAYYDVSFKVSNITNNPLNVSLSDLRLMNPNGQAYASDTITNDLIIFKNKLFAQKPMAPQEKDWAIRVCGMSFTLSEFMVTPANTNDGVFASYNGATIPIDWTNDAGTVYGGYVDLVSGELVKTHEIITINEIDISLSSGFGIYNDFATGYGNIQGQEATSGKTQEFILANFKSDKYPTILFNSWSKPTQEAIYFPLTGNNNFVRVYIATSRLEDISTTSAAKTSFQNYIKNNPFNIVYPLATHIHYQLTPTQLKTLVGTNNIWANNGSGNVEVSFWRH